MTYTTGGGNLHNSRRGLQAALRTGVRQLGFCEVNQITPLLRQARGYRLTQLAHSGPDKRRKGLWDNAVLTKAQVPSLGSIVMQASDRATPYRIALPRTVVCELTDDPDLGRMARIAIHPNYVGAANARPKESRIAENNEFNQVLRRVIQLAMMRVPTLVMNGDINLGLGVDTPGWLSTWEVAEQLGLQHVSYSPIDAAFWTPNVKPRRFKVIPAKEWDTDHDCFTSEFVPKR